MYLVHSSFKEERQSCSFLVELSFDCITSSKIDTSAEYSRLLSTKIQFIGITSTPGKHRSDLDTKLKFVRNNLQMLQIRVSTIEHYQSASPPKQRLDLD